MVELFWHLAGLVGAKRLRIRMEEEHQQPSTKTHIQLHSPQWKGTNGKRNE